MFLKEILVLQITNYWNILQVSMLSKFCAANFKPFIDLTSYDTDTSIPISDNTIHGYGIQIHDELDIAKVIGWLNRVISTYLFAQIYCVKYQFIPGNHW